MDIIRLLILLLGDILKVNFVTKKNSKIISKQRDNICEKKLSVCIHEWGGYTLSRRKYINKKIPCFTCGLQYQLDRFKDYSGDLDIDVTVTMSDIDLHNNLEYIKNNCNDFIEVSNKGMDFSGYSMFFNKIKNQKNCYILLTNSSVSSATVNADFIDQYIDCLSHNKNIGILGISSNSRCYQSIVRNNFTPHIQSFFLLTTLNVLKEIVALNNDKFPGAGIQNKQLLIRLGEIQISQLAIRLGYKLAVITDSGVNIFDNNINNWNLPIGDYRCHTKFPNSINLLNNDNSLRCNI